MDHEAIIPGRYCAFLSYRRTDNSREQRRWAGWLQRELERYQVPADLIEREKAKGRELPPNLYPIFRDEDSLPAGYDLNEWIKRGLERSSAMIVLCSPQSVKSRYVRDEIRQFKEMGKSHRIQAIILEGEPNASIPDLAAGVDPRFECFPHELRFGVEDASRTEPGQPPFIDWTAATQPIAADVRPEGSLEQGFNTPGAYRQHLEDSTDLTPGQIDERVAAYEERLRRAVCQIIAGLLEVDQEDIRNRDAEYRAQLARQEVERLRRRNRLLTIVGLIIVGLMVLSTVLGLRAEKQNQERKAALHRASQSSLGNAQDMIFKDDWGRAVDSIIEAVDCEPENATASRNLWVSLAYPFGNHVPLPDECVKVPGDWNIAALQPNGDLFVTCDDALNLRLHSLAAPDKEVVAVPLAELAARRKKPADDSIVEQQVHNLCWSPQGNHLAVEWSADEITILQVKDGELHRGPALPKWMRDHTKVWKWFGESLLIQTSELEMSDNPGTVSTSRIGLFDAATGTWTEASFPTPERGMLVAVHPDLSKVAFVVGGKGIDILKWPGGEVVRTERGDFKAAPLAVFLTQSSEFIFSSATTRELKVDELATSNQRAKSWRRSSEVMSEVLFSPDERFAACRLEESGFVVTDRQDKRWFLRLPHVADRDVDGHHVALRNDKLYVFVAETVSTYSLPGIFRAGAAVPAPSYNSSIAWSSDGQAICVIDQHGKKTAFQWPGLTPFEGNEELAQWLPPSAPNGHGREDKVAFYLTLDHSDSTKRVFVPGPKPDHLASIGYDNVNGERRETLLALPIPKMPPLGKDGSELLQDYRPLWDDFPTPGMILQRSELHQKLMNTKDYPDLPAEWRTFLLWWTTRPGERTAWY